MWSRVLTADSASCFFLAMSVAELFLCSSSSLRSTETKKADINNHPLGFTVEPLDNDSVSKTQRKPDCISDNQNTGSLPDTYNKELKNEMWQNEMLIECQIKWGKEEVHWLLFLCLCIWYDDQSVDGHVDQQGSHGGVEDSTGQQLICQVDWKQVRLTGTRQPAQRHQPKCTQTLENYAARWRPRGEWDLILGWPVLDLECDSLRDPDADSGWQDTVSADLPLCSIFHHSAKPARPVTRGTQNKRRVLGSYSGAIHYKYIMKPGD